MSDMDIDEALRERSRRSLLSIRVRQSHTFSGILGKFNNLLDLSDGDASLDAGLQHVRVSGICRGQGFNSRLSIQHSNGFYWYLADRRLDF